MATTEAGGGVPLELRERLTNRVRQYRYDGSETAWDMADAILAEIAAAGYELVERELLADLIRGIIATHGCHNCAESEAGVLFDYVELGEMLAGLDS
jgi:hypothetical protein